MRVFQFGLVLVAALLSCGCGQTDPAAVVARPSASAAAISHDVPVEQRSDLAEWPWRTAGVTNLGHGMTRYTAEDTRDGTTLTLLRFNTRAAPKLRFEIYDADEDDKTPNDDSVTDTSKLTAFQVFKHLQKRGEVLAVINGPFFRTEKSYGHTAPIVRSSQVYANVGNPRWTLGVKDRPDGQHFFLVHAASRRQLEGFSWGSGNVQALVVNGKPTRLLPPAKAIPEKKSPPSQPDDCGPYPDIDYLKVARTSLGWKKDEFALLIVTQAPFDNEGTAQTLRQNFKHQRSGWDIADLQQFWMAWGARGACNLDGGDATQLAYLAAEDGIKYRSASSSADHPDDSPPTRSTPVLLFPYVIKR